MPNNKPDATAQKKTQRHVAGQHVKVSRASTYSAIAKQKIAPVSKQIGLKGNEILVDKVVPNLQQGVKKAPRVVIKEIEKIHKKQHFWERFKSALFHKSLGLLLALISASVLGNFFETRRAENLWGLTSQAQIISEGSLAVITFLLEFVVALLVFTLTDYYLDEYKDYKQKKQAPEHATATPPAEQ